MICLIPFYQVQIEKITNKKIPIVVICWNNYYFVKNFIDQIKKFDNPIILLDNKSSFQPLLDYYKEIKDELNEKIEIRLLDENYGHTVYQKLKSTLPDIYILSDPDLELNKNMPSNFDEIFLNISNKYGCYKVGSALNIDHTEDLIECENYTKNQNIRTYESQFWSKPIIDESNELYYADIDTTFCLINNHFLENLEKRIRVAGNFTAKHLPWYKDYITKNISQDELNHWKTNNKSSSILFDCLKL
jgi:hypothetical protein